MPQESRTAIQRTLIGVWLLLSVASVIACWVFGFMDIGRAEGSGDGWGGLLALVSTLPTLVAVTVVAALRRTTAMPSWLGFAFGMGALVAASALSVLFAFVFIEHALPH